MAKLSSFPSCWSLLSSPTWYPFRIILGFTISTFLFFLLFLTKSTVILLAVFMITLTIFFSSPPNVSNLETNRPFSFFFFLIVFPPHRIAFFLPPTFSCSVFLKIKFLVCRVYLMKACFFYLPPLAPNFFFHFLYTEHPLTPGYLVWPLPVFGMVLISRFVILL